MAWMQFGVTNARGSSATLGVKVKLDVVECWVGGWVVILDRDILIRWLADPHQPLTRDEITFEADPAGLAVTFAGRVQRSVISGDDLLQFVTTVRRQLPPVDLLGAGSDTGPDVRTDTATIDVVAGHGQVIR